MVQDISASCTVLVISHRKRTIFNCENFYVIKDGSISQFDAFEDASHFQAFG
jgi:ABC-type bacteriocin/lantibiotic exporter with double-glycine peptidase domain